VRRLTCVPRWCPWRRQLKQNLSKTCLVPPLPKLSRIKIEFQRWCPWREPHGTSKSLVSITFYAVNSDRYQQQYQQNFGQPPAWVERPPEQFSILNYDWLRNLAAPAAFYVPSGLPRTERSFTSSSFGQMTESHGPRRSEGRVATHDSARRRPPPATGKGNGNRPGTTPAQRSRDENEYPSLHHRRGMRGCAHWSNRYLRGD
jgi:hypothetical protein